MPRLMSVAFTTDAVIGRQKTVTRRKGWRFLKPGDRLTLCRKVQGRKPGEPLERLAEVEVVSVVREQLADLIPDPWGDNPDDPYGADEVAREGFPGMDPTHFVGRYFIDAQGMTLDDFVTRIEWRYLDAAATSSKESGMPYTDGPFELNQMGLDVELVPKLRDPYGLGQWISEQPSKTQAFVLDGYWEGRGEPPADLMLRMKTVGAELCGFAHLPTVAAAAEHLLHALRGVEADRGFDR